MRRRSLLGVGVLCVLMFFTSCATSIRVRHLEPAEVDVSAFRNIAIASTERFDFPFRMPLSSWVKGSADSFFSLTSGFDSSLSAKTAEASGRYLVNAMQNSGYFTVMGPEVTDAYLTIGKNGENAYAMLKAKGVQALVRSSVSYMNCEEQIYSRDVKEWVTENLGDPDKPPIPDVSYEKVTGRAFYLEQQATVTFTYTFVDIQSNRIIATRSFTMQEESETYLGKTIFAKDSSTTDRDERGYTSGFAPSFFPLFDKMVKKIPSQIVRQLSPTWIESRVSLMANKPKADIGDAYKLAERGALQQAYDIFIQSWNRNSHVPSGYNAALLLEGLGRHSEALDLMNQVYNRSGDSRSYTQLLRLKDVSSQQDEAMKQIDGSSVSGEGSVVKKQIVTVE